jgi:hypothetical protein
MKYLTGNDVIAALERLSEENRNLPVVISMEDGGYATVQQIRIEEHKVHATNSHDQEPCLTFSDEIIKSAAQLDEIIVTGVDI